MRTENLYKIKRPYLKRAFLNWVGEKREEEEIKEVFSIGRGSENHLSLLDPYVSSRHGRILRQSKGFVLKDLNSLNGCFVNGTRVVEALLRDQDRIQMGKSEFVFSEARGQRNEALLDSSKNKLWNFELQKLSEMAKSDFSILLMGPSGVGKEVIGKLIHKKSKRFQSAFFAINCSAFQKDLIESELFGHKKGSFTGATFDRSGAFESAKGGSLFLDEIGDLPLSLQPKLLRVLENQEFRKIGSDQIQKTDVRVIAATNQDLKKKVSKGEFREDLFYRLNVLQINIPLLRERMEDFEAFLYFFAKKFRVRFSFSAIQEMKQYHWPGNIRELKNFIAKSSVLFSLKEVTSENIRSLLGSMSNTSSEESFASVNSSGSLIKKMEREMIQRALIQNFGNQTKAAQILKMPKSTLHDKVKFYNISIKKPSLKREN